MSRIRIIEFCGQCPECGFIDHDKTYCLVTGDEINVDTLPDNCPLPENVGRDYEAEIARLKREIMLKSNKFGK